MDFSNRGGQPVVAPTTTSPKGSKKGRGKWLRILSGALLVAIAILLGAVSLFLAFGGDSSESKYVNKDQFQAVFLNGGQVYFGKIRTLNNQYITMDNIYYLRVNNSDSAAASTASSAQDVSLAKLGCELHGPEDKMVINRDQVSFWENLKSDGQVAKAVAQYVQQNPQGQKCTDATAAETPATTTPAATTPAVTPTVKK